MDIKQMSLEITCENGTIYAIKVDDGFSVVNLDFDTSDKSLRFLDENDLSEFLMKNEFQFRGILHNKSSESFYEGFKLQFSLIDGKDITEFKNRENIIVKDKGRIFVMSYKDKVSIPEVYTDASYDEVLSRGAFCVLRKNLDGGYESGEFFCNCQDSNSAELEAVIKALEIYNDDLRIITDSQYVRKGITEWIIHWKLNDWHTANGTKAKNIEMWKRLELLCDNRRVEFGYVKAHNNHFENEYCDYMARIKRESNEQIENKKNSP